MKSKGSVPAGLLLAAVDLSVEAANLRVKGINGPARCSLTL